MITPAEQKRLQELHAYQVLDSRPEPELCALVDFVAFHFDIPIVLISLVDMARQWFLVRHGLELEETPRALSLCDLVIHEDRLVMIEDVRGDERTSHHPMVQSEFQVKSYVGAPLRTKKGFVLGTLCMLDNVQPRTFSDRELALFEVLARSVMSHLEARHALALAARAQAIAESAHHARAHFVSQLTHELRGPITTIQGYSELIEESVGEGSLADITSDVTIIKEANQELCKKLARVSAEIARQAHTNEE